MNLLEVENLSVSLALANKSATIVDDLSLSIGEGQCLGIVGESGSGKSTAALAIMGLTDPRNLQVDGAVRFGGIDLLHLPARRFRAMQGKDIAMIFQDPMSSLNPVHKVGDQIIECLKAHEKISTKQATKAAIEALERVGMPDPPTMMGRYPHQLSGGQRQRVLIAMAIVFKPRLLIADEPTTALDLTIQAQILELLKGLSRDLNMALLLITHDLGVVSEMTDQVIVLYSGRAVERGATSDVLESPRHPYTLGLMHAHPSIDDNADRLTPIPGAPPGLWQRPTGCAFRPRCPHESAACAGDIPTMASAGAVNHRVACTLISGDSDKRGLA
jgi:oligopeptide/dipeptide ABC transporter ATP-binding protein